VAFFNSLRELGTTLSLFQSDIPDYLKAVKNRNGLDYASLRRLKHVIELTGRLTSEQIPESIAALEGVYNGTGGTVDVCLASNILEVGIDIDRLSMMTVVGQPKTTSQYIQVTGRVGRRWWERPGLIVTIYGASKPATGPTLRNLEAIMNGSTLKLNQRALHHTRRPHSTEGCMQSWRLTRGKPMTPICPTVPIRYPRPFWQPYATYLLIESP
jgi:superfamily II DNA/RNA helicase